MTQTPIDKKLVASVLSDLGIADPGKANIRELVRIVNDVEQRSGIPFVRMEMGVPGLQPPQIGTRAEIEALEQGVASKYPMIEGLPALKEETSRFVKNFINIEVSARSCVPSVGSMQGGMAAFMVANRRYAEKDTILFIDPGFPVQKQQCRVMGFKYTSFDVYGYRGDKLRDKLEGILAQGNISCMVYSNPNNPAWICFNEDELQAIGELATKYDAVVIEDLAYFGMDFRKDFSLPGQAPYQPTAARYTDNYLLLISSSKAFSYAGQRIGMMVVADSLFERRFTGLATYFAGEAFGHSLVYGALYALSTGCAHSAQYGLAAMLRAANAGEFNFVQEVREYQNRARVMKALFTNNGFRIVYSHDGDEPIGDGFYFTVAYPGMQGTQLLGELLYYGISAISLGITGSDHHEGLRACVSQTNSSQFAQLEERLKAFALDHPLD